MLKYKHVFLPGVTCQQVILVYFLSVASFNHIYKIYLSGASHSISSFNAP